MNHLRHALWNAALATLVLLHVHAATSVFAQAPAEPIIGSRESFAGPPTQPTHVLSGHKYPVQAVAISPDMKTIASGGGMCKLPLTGKPGVGESITVKEMQALTQGEAFTWDLKTTKRKVTLSKPPGMVIGLSFTPNGKVIGGCLQNSPFAGGPPNPAVVFWDTAKGKPAHQYTGLSEPMAMAFLPDGKSVIIADRKRVMGAGFGDPAAFGPVGKKTALPDQGGGVIRVLQYPALSVSQEIDLTKSDRTSIVHVDSQRVAYREEHKAHIIDLATGQNVIVPAEFPQGRMRLSPDGKVIAILSENEGEKHSLQFFSVENGAAIGKPAAVIATWDPALAFSADSQWLALTTGWADDESLICVWDIANRKEIARFAGHQGGVNALALSNDDSILVSGGNDKSVLIWTLPAK